MSKIKLFFKKVFQESPNGWIYRWVLLSVLFMIVIHCLFVPVGPDWLQARWGAGDILTYASTISLGLLAVWQNKRFKEENGKSQERLERIAVQSNELAMINKILEHEEHRIIDVKAALKKFDDYSDMTRIAAQERESLKHGSSPSDMAKWNVELMASTSEVLHLLVNDPFTDNTELRENIVLCLNQATEVINQIMHGGALACHDRFAKACEELKNKKLDFMKIKEEYIFSVGNMYNRLLLDNLSLEDIKKFRINNKEKE